MLMRLLWSSCCGGLGQSPRNRVMFLTVKIAPSWFLTRLADSTGRVGMGGCGLAGLRHMQWSRMIFTKTPVPGMGRFRCGQRV